MERERERERGSWSRLENWRRLVEEACHCCLSLARARSSMVGPSTSLILAGFVCTTSKEKTNTQDEEPYKSKPMGTVIYIPFSASVLISLISDTWANGPHDIKLIFQGWGPITAACCWGSRASPSVAVLHWPGAPSISKKCFGLLPKELFIPRTFCFVHFTFQNYQSLWRIFNPRLFCLYGNELSGQVPDSIGKADKTLTSPAWE